MFEKIKAYYKNSPKRIGWTIYIIHLIFLLIPLTALVLTEGFEILTLTIPIILIFPTIFLIIKFGLLFSNVILSGLYYGLFALLCFKAKDTSSKSFQFLLGVFSLLFIVNVIAGLLLVFGGHIF